MSPTKTVTVGLLWHSLSSDNLGVVALTDSHVALIDSIADELGLSVNYVIYGNRGKKAGPDFGGRVRFGGEIGLRALLLQRRAIRDQFRELDFILDIGEGDSLADLYGVKRFLTLWISKYYAISTGIPVILSPQSIGPFQRSWTRVATRWILNRCRAVFIREPLSRQMLEAWKLRVPLEETTDLAFGLPYEKQALPADAIRVGVNVSALMYHGGFTRDNQFGLAVDYPELTKKMLQRLTADSRYRVWLVPHVITTDADHLVEDDYQTCLLLQEQFPQTQVAPRFQSAREAKSFIAGLDFFTGARMHACIAAYSSNVPLLPLAYSHKAVGIFKSLDYPVVVDCRSDSEQDILDRLDWSLAHREELQQRVKAGNAVAQQKIECYRRFLKSLLESHYRDE